MKYEYLLIRSRQLVDSARALKNPRLSEGDEVLIFEELNKLGSQGWDIIPFGNDYFGKKCVKP